MPVLKCRKCGAEESFEGGFADATAYEHTDCNAAEIMRLRQEVADLKAKLDADDNNGVELERIARYVQKVQPGAHSVYEVLDQVADLNRQLEAAQADTERYRQMAREEISMRKGEIWHWQGDGEDHIETLTCPIIIMPQAFKTALDAARGGTDAK